MERIIRKIDKKSKPANERIINNLNEIGLVIVCLKGLRCLKHLKSQW